MVAELKWVWQGRVEMVRRVAEIKWVRQGRVEMVRREAELKWCGRAVLRWFGGWRS
jgi:hypothetical protein